MDRGEVVFSYLHAVSILLFPFRIFHPISTYVFVDMLMDNDSDPEQYELTDISNSFLNNSNTSYLSDEDLALKKLVEDWGFGHLFELLKCKKHFHNIYIVYNILLTHFNFFYFYKYVGVIAIEPFCLTINLINYQSPKTVNVM